MKAAKINGLKNRKYVYADGTIYFGTKEAGDAYNICPSAVIHRTKSKSFPNWYYVDKDGNPI